MYQGDTLSFQVATITCNNKQIDPAVKLSGLLLEHLSTHFVLYSTSIEVSVVKMKFFIEDLPVLFPYDR